MRMKMIRVGWWSRSWTEVGDEDSLSEACNGYAMSWRNESHFHVGFVVC